MRRLFLFQLFFIISTYSFSQICTNDSTIFAQNTSIWANQSRAKLSGYFSDGDEFLKKDHYLIIGGYSNFLIDSVIERKPSVKKIDLSGNLYWTTLKYDTSAYPRDSYIDKMILGSDGFIYATCYGNDTIQVLKIDYENGKIIWNKKFSGYRPAHYILDYDSSNIILSYTLSPVESGFPNKLIFLSKKTGVVVVDRSLGETHGYSSLYGIAIDNMLNVYVSKEDTIIKFSRNCDSIKWKSVPYYDAPYYYGGNNVRYVKDYQKIQFVSNNNLILFGRADESERALIVQIDSLGNKLKAYTIRGSNSDYFSNVDFGTLVEDNNSFYVSWDNRTTYQRGVKVVKLNKFTANLEWTTNLYTYIYNEEYINGMTYINGKLFTVGLGRDGMGHYWGLYCIDTASGNQIYAQKIANGIGTGIFGIDQTLFLIGDESAWLKYDAKLLKYEMSSQSVVSNTMIKDYIVLKDTIQCDPLSLSNDQKIDQFFVEIYPNPSNDKFYIKNSTNENSTIILYDVLFKSIKEVNSSSEIIEMPIGDLSPGIYYLTINISDVQVKKKVVVYK